MCAKALPRVVQRRTVGGGAAICAAHLGENMNRLTVPVRRRRPRKTIILVNSALVFAGLVAGSGPAAAVHDLTMQLDGNTRVDTSGPTYDWQSFFQGPGDISEKTGALPSGFLARGHTADYALPESTTFATGSKDTLNIGKTSSKAAGWQCGNSNNLGAKDDLVNVYTTAYRDPGTNHLILYFGAEKSSNLGDNNIGIWFLQDSSVGCVVPATGRNTDFSGHHIQGDVLLTAAFTNGGTKANVEARTWKNGADNGGEGLLSAPDTGFLCGAGGSGDKACAITNLSDFDPPWSHPVKTAGANGTALAPQEFYEGGVDVTQLQIDAGNTGDPCITTFLADTRSSQSPTATLFDFASGSFPVCRPATTLTVSRSPATIYSGNSVTWTAVEQNTGTSPINNVTVTDAAASGACSPFAYVSGDTNSNNRLDPGANNLGESWTFTCTQALTASKTIHVYGSGTDTISGQTVAGGPTSACTFNDSVSPPTVTFAAVNTVCDPNERASASVTVISPSTSLQTTAAPATATPATIHSGESTTLAFFEKNTGGTVLTNPHVDTDLSGTTCATTTAIAGVAGGDTNNDGVFDPGETWKFTCSTAFSTTTTVTAIGHGTDPLGRDITTPDYPLETTTVTVTVINPDTQLSTTANAAITYTFKELNTGDSAIASPHVTVAAGTCDAAPAYLSGDVNNNGLLDAGTTPETWVFTCTHTLSGPTADTGSTTTYVDAHGHGYDTTGADVTKCPSDETRSPQPACRNSGSEADGTAVTITNSARN